MSSINRTVLGLISVSLAAACGSSGDTPTPGGASDAAVDTRVTPTVDGSTGSGLGTADTRSATIELDIAPGVETTVCVTVQLQNADAMYITKATGELLPGSHHLIIYRSNATTEAPTPTPCSPFNGLLSGAEVMIGEATKPLAVTTMPDKVGLKIGPKQMLKLEAHYINTTKAPIRAKGTWTIEGVPATTPDMIEANGFFWGTTKLNIPPKSAWDTGVQFQAGLPGTKAFFLVTHQHRFGKKMTVWPSSTRGDTSATPLVEETNWADPAMLALSPHVAFDGTSGFSYKCEYLNDESSEVTFGLSANQEMCFAIGWYYPAAFFDICFDEKCFNRK